MKKTQIFVAIILVTPMIAIVVAAIVGGVGFGLAHVQRVFDALDPQTAIILGVASVVALLGARVVSGAARSAKEFEIESGLQRDRTRLYLELLQTLSIYSNAITCKPSPLATSLFLIGPPRVIQEYRTLVQMIFAGNASEAAVRMQINRLVLAMRRDIGESTFGLDQEDWSGWLQSPVLGNTSEPINGATSPHRPEFMAPAVRL
jgi:hypothetical protein